MYSSDAKFIPELYYLAAKWGRQIVAEVLDEAIAIEKENRKPTPAIHLIT